MKENSPGDRSAVKNKSKFRSRLLLAIGLVIVLIGAGRNWYSWRYIAEIRQSIKSRDWDTARQQIADYSWWAALKSEVALLSVRVERMDGNDESFKSKLSLARIARADDQQIEQERLLDRIQKGFPNDIQQPVDDVLRQFSGDEEAVYEAFANGYLTVGAPHQAIEVLDRWNKQFPSDARSFLVRGYVFGAYEKNDYARDAYARAVELDPNILDAHFSLAVLLGKENRFAEALEHYRTVFDREPSRIDLQLGIGETLWAMHRKDEAVEYFTNILQDHPNVFRAGYLVGQYHTNLGDGSSALAALAPVRECFPENAAINYQWGLANELVGNHQAATEALQKFIYANGQLDRLKPILQAARQSGNYNDLMQIADTYHRYQWEQGVEWLRLAIQAAPQAPQAYYEIARYMEESGAFDAAANQRAMADNFR